MTTLAGFSPIAAALADPAREAMIAALVGGCALPAGELATAAGLSPSGASAHLQKLRDAGILVVVAQGKFRYYRLADEEVASALEALANIAGRARLEHASIALSRCAAVRAFLLLPPGWPLGSGTGRRVGATGVCPNHKQNR
jgi:DNA-binding transcriptional ArsR family regulator